MVIRTRLSRHPHPLFLTSQGPAAGYNLPTENPPSELVPTSHSDRLLAPDDEPNLHTRDDGQEASPADDASIHAYFLEAAAERCGEASPTCMLTDRYSPRDTPLTVPETTPQCPPSELDTLRLRCRELEEENARLRRQLAGHNSPSTLSDLAGSSLALRQRRVAASRVDPEDL